MSWDIYGNPLQRGHCEVHPHVHEEYPCSLCMSERGQTQQPHDVLEQLQYEFAKQGDYIKQLEAERNALISNVDMLAGTILTALRGTIIDEHGNRGDDGLLPFGFTITAINALRSAESLAMNVVSNKSAKAKSEIELSFLANELRAEKD